MSLIVTGAMACVVCWCVGWQRAKNLGNSCDDVRVMVGLGWGWTMFGGWGIVSAG